MSVSVRALTIVLLGVAFCLGAKSASADGSDVTFSLGSTGAVIRPLSSKLQERISVLDFGADPSGVNDSTAAIQAALAAVPNGAVYFPSQGNGAKATYRVTTIHVLRTQRLVGEEALSSELFCTSTAVCLIFGDPDGLTYAHGGIDNLAITGPGADGSSVGLYLGGDPLGLVASASAHADFLTFQNVRITNFGVAVKMGNNAYEDSFSNPVLTNNGTGLLFPTGTSNSGEMITVFGGTISVNRTAIENDSAAELSLHGVAIDYNQVGVSGSNVWFYAYGCHFEQASGPLINISGGTRVVLDGNTYLLAANTGSDSAMINFSNSYVAANIQGGDAYSNHPVSYFVNAINALSYNLHIGGGINVSTYHNIGAVVNPASASGITTDLNGVLNVGSLVLNGKCTGCGSTASSSAGAAVTAFNGRSNAVLAMTGDYSLDQIAAPKGPVNIPLNAFRFTLGAASFTSSTLTLDSSGFSAATPAILGFSSGSKLGAEQIQLGDNLNVIQNASGSRMQISSYWPLELRGNQQGAGPKVAPGVTSDAAINMYGSPTSSEVLDVYDSTGSSKLFSVNTLGLATARGFALTPNSGPPSCDASSRGVLFLMSGGGSADKIIICAYTGETYAWQEVQMAGVTVPNVRHGIQPGSTTSRPRIEIAKPLRGTKPIASKRVDRPAPFALRQRYSSQ